MYVLSACAAPTAAVGQGVDADEEHDVYAAYHPAKLREGRPHPGKAEAALSRTGTLLVLECQTTPCSRTECTCPESMSRVKGPNARRLATLRASLARGQGTSRLSTFGAHFQKAVT